MRMSAPSPARNSIGSADFSRPAKDLTWTAAIGFSATGAIVLYFAMQQSTSNVSQTAGDIAILASSLFATVACVRAARRRDATARGWALMAAATLFWSLGQLIFTYYGVARDHVYPFPSVADAGFLSFIILALAALFAFPRPPALLISRIRVILDALVIGMGIAIISKSAVLHHLYEALGSGAIAQLTGLVYPVLDITIGAVVLSLGMGRPAGQRLFWMVLGAGLITLAVTDSIYVRLLADGHTAISATPLTGGWMFAFFFIGLATLVPTRATADRIGRGAALGVQLIPYVPVLLALIVLGRSAVTEDTFVLVMAILLLIVVSIRQVMIVYENVTLTRDLEAKVAARTAELNTLGSIVTSSSDAIVGLSLDGPIIAWNPAAEQLYGHRAGNVIGRPPEFLNSAGLQAMREVVDTSP